jgi:hypothetical protein
MKKTAVGYLAVAVAMMAWSPAIAQQESSITQRTETVTAPAAPPVVLDSYMKPAYSRVKETTDKEGNTEKEVQPLIMERHEQVAIPGQETHVTTVQEENRNATQTTEKAAVVAAPKVVVAHKKAVYHRHVAYRPRRAQHVAYRPTHKYVAVANQSQKTEQQITNRTVVNEQTIQSPPTVIERRDPALDLP